MSEIHLSKQDKIVTSRRDFLKTGMLVVAGAAFPVDALARIAGTTTPERALSFYNTHTGEQLDRIVYWADGRYVSEHLKEINHILRDFRTDEIKQIDPKLLDILYNVQRRLQVAEPLHIVSGYRSKATNADLRHASSGVAKKSFHTKGKAIDFRIPGWNVRDIRKAAMRMKLGGVGYYPDSDFVHLDTGPFRTW
ncbi:DUF882 domain-containing protein [Trichloromonas sp.]|uniref:DUF882 domain-containing protein n=1 Tax=Trichloromonas sp. TaxID=3069249 RepID=UPI003D813FD1